ncbi:MAG: lipoate--protein ligase family protein, partial [Limisphaerales bacterium]
MSAIWNLLHTGAGAPSWNMAFDEALLEQCGAIGTPILRLYSWSKPAATFGYSQHYDDIAAWAVLRPLIRRPTGGGLVPHDIDWTYSLVFPPSDSWYHLRAEESYRRVHDWISSSFKAMQVQAELSDCCDKPVPGRCFVGAEKFDVLAGGKKIAGAAQKRNKSGLLVQGSIQPPAGSDRAAWEKVLLETGSRELGIEWRELKPGEALLARAAEL